MNKEEILAKLNEAAHVYYNNLPEIMSDEEYDELNTYAESQGWLTLDDKLNDNSNININKSIKHEVPMLSLKKAKDLDTISKYVTQTQKYGAKTYRIEPKLDGLALNINYENELTLSTRGSGVEGEDVSYLLKDNKLTINNLPFEVPDNIKEIRGELFCSKEDLIFNNSQKESNFFKNERSAASGIVRKAELGLEDLSQLDFVAYFAIDKNNKFINIPTNIVSAYNLFPENNSTSYDELAINIELAKQWRLDISAPTDGIVIKPNELIEIGNTEHHPQEYIAFKYPGEQKESEVLDITISVGRTGKVTPNVKIKPIEVAGVTISNITGNNFKWLEDKKISIGSKVLVTRANDVIPKIVIVTEKSDNELKIPTNCPYCNTKLEYKINRNEIESADLYCNNKECQSRLLYELKTLVSKNYLDIDGLSEEVLKSLKLTNVIDLINLKLEDLIDVKYEDSGVSLGKIRAKSIISNIEKAKENTETYKWLMCLGFSKIGPSSAKKIIEVFNSLDNFFDNKEATIKELKKINGFGNSLLEVIDENFDSAKSIYSQLLNNGVTIKNKEKTEIKGYFAQTGKVPSEFNNRSSLVKFLEDNNWKFTNSVTKETQYLITDNLNASSSKMKKAIKNNVTILLWEDFKKLL